MLKILGRTDVFLYLEIAKKSILLIPLSVGAFIGIYWMLIASIGTSIIAFFLNSYYSGKALHYTSWMQLKDVAPSYGIAIAITLPVFFMKYLPVSYWIVLPLQLIVGLSIFLLIGKFAKSAEYAEIENIMKRFLHRGKVSSL